MKGLPAAVIGLWFAVSPPPAASQSPTMSPQEFHDRIVAIIVRRAPKDMPEGDTTITWNRTPILYHIVQSTAHSLRSGFLRNDSLVGIAAATWGADGVHEFDVRWTAADSLAMHLHAVREGPSVVLTGVRTDTLSVPSLPWAIADFGMDEHLVPMLRQLPPDSTFQRVVIYRPWGGKWRYSLCGRVPGQGREYPDPAVRCQRHRPVGACQGRHPVATHAWVDAR